MAVYSRAFLDYLLIPSGVFRSQYSPSNQRYSPSKVDSRKRICSQIACVHAHKTQNRKRKSAEKQFQLNLSLCASESISMAHRQHSGFTPHVAPLRTSTDLPPKYPSLTKLPSQQFCSMFSLGIATCSVHPFLRHCRVM